MTDAEWRAKIQWHLDHSNAPINPMNRNKKKEAEAGK